MPFRIDLTRISIHDGDEMSCNDSLNGPYLYSIASVCEPLFHLRDNVVAQLAHGDETAKADICWSDLILPRVFESLD